MAVVPRRLAVAQMQTFANGPLLSRERTRSTVVTHGRPVVAGVASGRIARRGTARLGRLLKGVGETEQGRFAPGAAGERRAEGIIGGVLAVEAGDEAGRHLNARGDRLGPGR